MGAGQFAFESSGSELKVPIGDSHYVDSRILIFNLNY